MSTQIASLYAKIGADTGDFEKGAKKVKGGLGELGNSFKSILPPGIAQFASLGGAIAGVSAALAYSVKQAAEAQKVDAQLNAVLASTHSVAGMTADQLDGMATSLSRVSTYDDEAIKGSEALLLTFTKIGSDVFPKAQQAILDISTAMGGDLQGATIQLGKALNDPIAGLTALTRVGVSFTAEQKDMIKAMVESGDVIGAQKLILQELSTEFGGSALAASKTYAGQTAILKNELANLAEEVGADLLPAVSKVTTHTITLMSAMDLAKEAGINWMNTTQEQKNEFMMLAKAQAGAFDTTREFGRAGDDLAGTLQDSVIPAVEDLSIATDEVSAANEGLISLMGTLQGETDRYKDTAADLHEKQDALRADYVQGKVNAEEYTAQMGELTDAVKANQEAHEQAGRAIMFDLVKQEMMVGGLADTEKAALQKMGVEWGIFSQQTVTEANKYTAAAEMLAGVTEEQAGAIGDSWKDPLAKLTTLNEKLKAAQNLSGMTWTYGFAIEVSGSIPNLPFANINPGGSGGGMNQQFATGGEFIVPASYGYEGFNMGGMATASAGEKITIGARGATNAQGDGQGNWIFNNTTINVHANNVDEFMMSLAGEI